MALQDARRKLIYAAIFEQGRGQCLSESFATDEFKQQLEHIE